MPRSLSPFVHGDLSISMMTRIVRVTIIAALVAAVVAALPGPARSWPHLFPAEVHSSPMLADINRDGITEVIVLTKDGKLNVLGPDDSPTNGWPLQIGPPSSISDGQNWVSGSAAVAELDNDGIPWILQTGFDGNLHALNGAAQERAGFPIHMGSYSADTPTVADLDGDGYPEIICRYNPNSIGIWSRSGQMLPGWPRSIANAPPGAIDVWSCPAVTDLDEGTQGDLEIVAGDYAGLCHAWHHTGAVVSGWPVNLNPDGTYPGWVLSSPAAVMCEPYTRQILIGSDDDRLFLLNGDGTNAVGWPKVIPFGFRASPAAAPLLLGPAPQFVIGHRSNQGDLRLYAFDNGGNLLSGWPVIQPAPSGGYTFGWLSPVLADLDGDFKCEVIAVKERRAGDPSQSEVWGFTAQGTVLPGFPIALQGLAYAMPSIGDFDSDGLAEILIGDLSRRLYKIDLSGSLTSRIDEWRLLQHDLGHTGETGWWEVPGVGGNGATAQRVLAVPNPFRTRVTLGGSGCSWRVFDASGRFLRELPVGAAGPVWDGRTDAGRASAPGVYVAHSSSGMAVRLVKLP